MKEFTKECPLPKTGLTTFYGINEYKCNLVRNENCKQCMMKALQMQDEYFKKIGVK